MAAGQWMILTIDDVATMHDTMTVVKLRKRSTLRPHYQVRENSVTSRNAWMSISPFIELHFTKTLATRHEQRWLTSSGYGRGRCWKPPPMNTVL